MKRQTGFVLRRVRPVASLFGQGIVTAALIMFDVIKSGSGGGSSSSVLMPVVFPAPESDTSSINPARKSPQRRRSTRGRTN